MQKNIRVMAILLGLFLLSGCATAGPLVIQDDRWVRIIKSGTALSVNYQWLDMPIKTATVFTPQDEKVYWYGKFQPFTFMLETKMHAIWYAPDDSIYAENDFQEFLGTTEYAATGLNIQGNKAAELLGEWRVEIYLNGQLIDKKTFYMREKVTRLNVKRGETVKVESGKTTKEYVLEKFGEPHKVEKRNKGEVWYYYNFEVESAGKNEILTHVVGFDENGIVADDFDSTIEGGEDVDYSSDEGKMPNIKVKSLEESLREKEIASRWKENEKKYGKPDRIDHDNNKKRVAWLYKTEEKAIPAEDKRVSLKEVAEKALIFDEEGNFIEEGKRGGFEATRSWTKEESASMSELFKESGERVLEDIQAKMPSQQNQKVEHATVLKKYKECFKTVKSYHLEIDKQAIVGNDVKKGHLTVDFLWPSTQKVVYDLGTEKDTYLFIKDKTYLLVPYANKWVEKNLGKSFESIKELGELERLSKIIETKPSNIIWKHADGKRYIVLIYKNILKPPDLIVPAELRNMASDVRFYLNADTYCLESVTEYIAGNASDSKETVFMRQIDNFSKYNDSLNIILPDPNDLYIAPSVPTKLPSEIFKSELKKFTNAKHHVELEYPSQWYVKEVASEEFYQLFISKEKVEQVGDRYLTGISVMKIYDAKKRMGLESSDPAQVADELLKRIYKAIDSSKSVVILFPNRPIQVGADTGFITELSFTDKYGTLISVFRITLYKNDTFVHIGMESTRQDFDKYRKLFLDLILRIKVF
jgi:outer membrane protein assembly factor BamE (lipoprotein component of BamABCDE complex)